MKVSVCGGEQRLTSGVFLNCSLFVFECLSLKLGLRIWLEWMASKPCLGIFLCLPS